MKGWKTLVFGAIIAALGAIQATDVATVVPAGWEGLVMSGIGLVVMYLRTLTDTPVLNSTPKA